MEITPIKPNAISLLSTLRCSAACDNCCFGCNPKQGRSMTYDEMKGYVDMGLETYPDTIKKFCLTGGECMLLGKDVDRILAYCKSRGLECSMVSNAFWATDYEKAFKTLKRLQRSGLALVAFSTGDDHNQYVPWTNVKNACLAAARLGLSPELRYEERPGHMSILRHIEADEEMSLFIKSRSIKIMMNTWMEYNNKGAGTRRTKVPFPEYREIKGCSSLFQDIIIDPYGEVYACCGIGACHIPQMRLGNVQREPIKDIYERAFNDFLKIWLYMDGPQAVLKYVHEKTGMKFNRHTKNHCDICRTIFTDKRIIPLIRDNFFDAAYYPLLLYNTRAEKENEERAKR